MKIKCAGLPISAIGENCEPTETALYTATKDDKRAKHLAIADYSAIAAAPSSLAWTGLNYLAYVRPSVEKTRKIWSVYSASGHLLWVAPTLETARSAILENHMLPTSVH